MMKYKLTKEKIKLHNNKILYRIEALKDIPEFNVKKGDKGGFIEKEENLSQGGNCWIDETSKIFGNAKVLENVFIGDYVEIFGEAELKGNLIIKNYSRIGGNVQLNGNFVLLDTVFILKNKEIRKIEVNKIEYLVVNEHLIFNGKNIWLTNLKNKDLPVDLEESEKEILLKICENEELSN